MTMRTSMSNVVSAECTHAHHLRHRMEKVMTTETHCLSTVHTVSVHAKRSITRFFLHHQNHSAMDLVAEFVGALEAEHRVVTKMLRIILPTIVSFHRDFPLFPTRHYPALCKQSGILLPRPPYLAPSWSMRWMKPWIVRTTTCLELTWVKQLAPESVLRPPNLC